MLNKNFIKFKNKRKIHKLFQRSKMHPYKSGEKMYIHMNEHFSVRKVMMKCIDDGKCKYTEGER